MSNGNPSSAGAPPRRVLEAVTGSLKRRYASERRFRLLGRLAVLTGLVFVGSLFLSIILNGYTGFQQTYLKLSVTFDQETLDPAGKRDPAVLDSADYGALVKRAMQAAFPEVSGRSELRELFGLVSSGAEYQLQDMVEDDPSLIGTTRDVWLIASDDLDMVVKGHIDRTVPEDQRRVSDRVLAWLDALDKKGAIDTRFNKAFFTNGDSREPELAGIGGAVMGSFYTLLVCLVISFPIGVSAAVYLEEFAPKNRLTDLIEVNINNLAAVPSIVFGLLGLAVLINFFGMPRSAPIVGGLVLALMVLPTIIIAGRAALKSVPPSIREAALGVAPRPAAGDARHDDGHDHRHGARAGRDRAAADDRHGGLRGGRAEGLLRPLDPAAGAGLPVGRQPGARLRRKDGGRDHGAAGLPDRHERPGRVPAQALRAALVGR